MMPGMLSAEEMARLAEAKGTAFDRLFLDGMIKQAVHGESFNGDDIAKIVGCYLVQFCFDADCVLEVASQARDFAALAEQSLHTSLLGMALAIEMGMGEGDIRTIGLCGLLHAWGLIRIPERIRNANRVLSQSA